MNEITDSLGVERLNLREMIDPLRLYDPRIPAGRFIFLWGLAIYPLAVMSVLLTAIIIIFETAFHTASSDYLGIIIMMFMLGWVAATVAITRRRLFQLGKTQNWVWVAIFPIVNLPLFLYLLFKPGLDTGM